MQILVIGGAGYIGATVSHKLIAAGHQLVILDDLSTGQRSFVPTSAVFIEGDGQNPDLLKSTLTTYPCQAIILLAAKIKVGESMEQPGAYFKTNLNLVINALEAARNHNVPYFLFSSSGSTYGDNLNCPLDETTPLNAQSIYTETKVMAEKIIGWYQRVSDITPVIFRYFNAAGCFKHIGQTGPLSHLIPIISEVALNLRPELVIFGNDYPTPDGTCIRDYIHVEDIADAHVNALDALLSGNLKSGGVFNLGQGVGNSNLEVVETFIQANGIKIPYRFGPRRPNNADCPCQFADASLAKTLINWQATRSLSEIVQSDYAFRKALHEKKD